MDTERGVRLDFGLSWVRLMLPIIGWVLWAVVVILALSWTYGLRVYTKRGQDVPISTAVQTMFLWFIALAFLFIGYSKLHILWVAPLLFISSFFVPLTKIPVLTPVLLWFTGLFVEIALAGVKRPAE